MPTSDWPKNPDGSKKKFGELTREQQDAVLGRVTKKLQGELNDPNSAFRRNCEALLFGPDVPKSVQ